MDNQKKTPWFSPKINPVHKGVYETMIRGENGKWFVAAKWYWDGVRWCWKSNIASPLFEQHRRWRGLAEKP